MSTKSLFTELKNVVISDKPIKVIKRTMNKVLYDMLITVNQLSSVFECCAKDNTGKSIIFFVTFYQVFSLKKQTILTVNQISTNIINIKYFYGDHQKYNIIVNELIRRMSLTFNEDYTREE